MKFKIKPIQIESSKPIRYAGFWIRASASALDDIVLSIVSLVFYYPLKPLIEWSLIWTNLGGGDSTWMVEGAASFISMFIVSIPYYIHLQAFWGTTFGKRALNIYVVDEKTLKPMTQKQATLRFFLYFVSLLPYAAGFMMVALHRRKQALHDVFAGTVSIRYKI